MHLSEKRRLLNASIGNIVEWYDFSLYAAATPLIFAQQFFPAHHSSSFTQLQALAVFASGFVVRPLGGMIFGLLGDRRGHDLAMLWTLIVIGLATVSVGLLPTYAQTGTTAPILLLVLRLVQGLAAGGEWAGAALLIGATPLQRNKSRSQGLSFALSQSGIAVGMLLGNAGLWVTQQTLSHDAFVHYGWRLPFLATVPFLIVGIWLRKQRTACPVPQGTPFRHGVKSEKITTQRLALLCGIALRMAESACVYLVLVFGLSYGHSLQIPASWLLLSSTIAIAADILAIPIYGLLIDRFGAVKIFASGAIILGCSSPFFFAAFQQHSLLTLVAAFICAIAFCHAPMIAAEPILLTQMFPSSVRYRGIAIAHEIGGVVAGGVSPLIAAQILHTTGSIHGITAYIALLAIFALIALSISSSIRRHLSLTGRVRYEDSIGT